MEKSIQESQSPPLPEAKKKVSVNADSSLSQEVPNKEGQPHIVVSRHHDTTTPQHHDTVIPNNHDTTIPDGEITIIESVRRAVKHLGKEPATQRLTLEEKRFIREIEYVYDQKSIITSGNEIIRIALNYLICDYRKNKEQSILSQVLEKLNS